MSSDAPSCYRNLQTTDAQRLVVGNLSNWDDTAVRRSRWGRDTTADAGTQAWKVHETILVRRGGGGQLVGGGGNFGCENYYCLLVVWTF